MRRRSSPSTTGVSETIRGTGHTRVAFPKAALFPSTCRKVAGPRKVLPLAEDSQHLRNKLLNAVLVDNRNLRAEIARDVLVGRNDHAPIQEQTIALDLLDQVNSLLTRQHQIDENDIEEPGTEQLSRPNRIAGDLTVDADLAKQACHDSGPECFVLDDQRHRQLAHAQLLRCRAAIALRSSAA